MHTWRCRDCDVCQGKVCSGGEEGLDTRFLGTIIGRRRSQGQKNKRVGELSAHKLAEPIAFIYIWAIELTVPSSMYPWEATILELIKYLLLRYKFINDMSWPS